MADSSEEIKALKERVEKAENAIRKLEEAILRNAKNSAANSCTLTYNIAQFFITGTDRQSFTKRWKSRLDDTNRRIAESETVDDIIKIVNSFTTELSDYVRAEKVRTAEEAKDIAHTFMKKYSPVALPLKVMREENAWLVDIDVGALATKIAKVKVDARTGDILSYEIPEK